ncbi:BCS1 N terminal-domain-containing protein, partial [Xylariales sp. PMI_506]
PQAPQLVLLDMFFPGFSVFASAVHKYLHIDLNLYIPMVLLIGALTVVWNYSSQYFWDQLETHFMSSVDIRTDDEIYNIIMTWVAGQRFSQGARRFVVNTNVNSRSWNLWRWDTEDEDEESSDQNSEVQKKKALSYTPSFGTHYFWYRGRLLLFKRNSKEQNNFMAVSEREEISVCCFGRDPWILKELILEARSLHIEKDQQKTLIYRGTSRSGSAEPTWQRCMARAPRPFSTVILNELTKKALIDDVTDYLNPATQRWYSNRGIPYRRGYLLHGPPGTGKSSLSLALAGFFKMRIYIVSLSSVTANEENLATLFAELPRRCVVLLEDIDTAGLTHTRDNNQPASADIPSAPEPLEPGQLTPGNGNTINNNNQQSGRLSLSGLLNILDGVASQEGRVLIMTTNHVEKLDKALIRPGRVDMIVEFGRADSEMTAAIFSAIFAHLEGDDGVKPDDEDTLSPEARDKLRLEREQKRKEDDARVQALSLEFATKIPAHEFSPAELQGHLMRHKRDPRKAIDTAEEFVEQTRKDRKEKEMKEAEDKRKAEEKKKEEAAKKQKEEEEKKKEEEEKKKK